MFVIPMAGKSSRFTKAGYTKPKFMLKSHGKTIFEWAVSSFRSYFLTEQFLFIVRDKEALDFVNEYAVTLGIVNFSVLIFEGNSLGQADTVSYGLRKMQYIGEIYIFNIDTYHKNFQKPPNVGDMDGYLEVFLGDGEHWSFAKVDSNKPNLVSEVAEKRRISDLCSNGLYYFASSLHFIELVESQKYLPNKQWDAGELYIAPLYNLMIESGAVIHCVMVDKQELEFIGTPEEYLEFNRKVGL